MGLIKSTLASIGGTLQDQWKETIRCENMPNDILMVKKTTENGVISNGSTIIVEPGQCAVICDNGKVIDASAEEGVFTFDTSSSPSFFEGQFGEVFKEMWQRFTYNGASAKEQAVYYFNTKEIMDNKFGTPAPIPFQDWAHPIKNQIANEVTPLRVDIKCFGKYTFKITNPALFMSTIAGTSDAYSKGELVEQIRAEVIAIFQNIVNELGNEKHKVPALEMPSNTDEIKEIMDERVYDEKIRERGIEIVCFAVESVTLTEESNKKIDEYELGASSYMQQARLVDAYANAVQDVAQNSNGPANGFVGIGMMNNMAGGAVSASTNGPWNSNNSTQEENNKVDFDWKCYTCGKENSNLAKYCCECGKPRQTLKKCEKCGTENSLDSKFCTECGEKI